MQITRVISCLPYSKAYGVSHETHMIDVKQTTGDDDEYIWQKLGIC